MHNAWLTARLPHLHLHLHPSSLSSCRGSVSRPPPANLLPLFRTRPTPPPSRTFRLFHQLCRSRTYLSIIGLFQASIDALPLKDLSLDRPHPSLRKSQIWTIDLPHSSATLRQTRTMTYPLGEPYLRSPSYNSLKHNISSHRWRPSTGTRGRQVFGVATVPQQPPPQSSGAPPSTIAGQSLVLSWWRSDPPAIPPAPPA